MVPSATLARFSGREAKSSYFVGIHEVWGGVMRRSPESLILFHRSDGPGKLRVGLTECQAEEKFRVMEI